MRAASLGIRSHLLLAVLAVVCVGFGAMYLVTGQLLQSSLLEEQRRKAAWVARLVAGDLARRARAGEDVQRILDEWSAATESGCLGLLRPVGELPGPASPGLEGCLGPAEIHALRAEPDQAVWFAGLQGSMVAVAEAVPATDGVELLTGGARVAHAARLSDASAQISTVRTLVLLFMGLAVVLGVVLGYALLTQLFIRPLERLRGAMRRVEDGDLTARARPSGGQELLELASSFNAMTARLQDHEVRIARQIGELTRMNRQLEQAADNLVRSEKLASVGRLAAGVAHEIGNPISIVVGYLEMLRRPDVTAEERSLFLEQCYEAVGRISAIIRDLLDFSRPERGDAIQRADVRLVVAQSLALLGPQKQFKQLRFEPVDISSPGVSLVAAIEERRLQQVLVNVLMNAADACLFGGGEPEPLVRVEMERAAGRIIVRVRDNGPGVPDEVRRSVFDPFFTTKEPGKGTGLGLSICYSIVTSRGGNIRIDNADGGRGAVVTLDLVAADPNGATPEEPGDPGAPPRETPGGRPEQGSGSAGRGREDPPPGGR